ncbi:MAG: transglycosylase SLT domain-containing protein [Betaproteobacteria bacterium]|nr:transglycosylase SLT domain-containing protein [Betaproteobacteria bacterium]MCL2886637.1 transglycosylase SLT domain-containing protein [Betaproteobacteria bacterium]
MFATTTLIPAVQRIFLALGGLFRKTLMAAGMVLMLGLAGLQIVHGGVADGLKLLLPPAAVDAESPAAEEAGAAAASAELTPRMESALDFVSRRYRVAGDALRPVFVAAQLAGRELRLDPLLIIAVIGVESGFNPFSQSVYGAQGLMQVVPRFHADKLTEEAPPAAFLDPVTNVQVGATVLRESINRMGGLEEGLQQFGGALSDPTRRYAGKVLAEKQRLEQAALRLRAA